MSDILQKSMVPKPSDFHSFVELTGEVRKKEVLKPGLITSIINPFYDYHSTNSFIYELDEVTVQIPNSKRFDQRGDYVAKDVQNNVSFIIPSSGLQGQVKPRDVANRRIPGTMDAMTPEYAIAREIDKIDIGWDLHTELGMAQLLTADTNYLGSNAVGTSYNYYTVLEGTSRPAAVDVLLGGVADPHIAILTAKKQLLQYAAKFGLSGRVVALCGDTFFNSRAALEANEGLARPLGGKDLATSALETITNNSWNYDMLMGSRDNILYINYGSEIIAGQNLIADNSCYLVLAGTGAMGIHFAPADTMETVNQLALGMYRWYKYDSFSGARIWTESNRLFFNKYPGSIIKLISSN